MKRLSSKGDETPSRPITFRAAQDLGEFELAQLWTDRTAWPIDERTSYDELSELAVMSALAAWLRLWQPLTIHGAILACKVHAFGTWPPGRSRATLYFRRAGRRRW